MVLVVGYDDYIVSIESKSLKLQYKKIRNTKSDFSYLVSLT